MSYINANSSGKYSKNVQSAIDERVAKYHRSNPYEIKKTFIERYLKEFALVESNRSADYRSLEFSACQEAGVPLVDIDQNVIYSVTNLLCNGVNDQQDMIEHQLSNQDRLDKLLNELSILDASVAHIESTILTTSNNIADLSGDGMIVGPSDNSEYVEKIESTRKTLKSLGDSLVRLNNDRISVQSKLIREQSFAMREASANPTKILSSDEILANYYEEYAKLEFD